MCMHLSSSSHDMHVSSSSYNMHISSSGILYKVYTCMLTVFFSKWYMN
jgi:hypothetical protein